MTAFVLLHGLLHGAFDSPLRPSHPVASHHASARAQTDWTFREVAAGHNAMITAPALLMALLEELTA